MRKITIFILLICLSAISCVFNDRERIRGNGILTTETLNYADFNSVKSYGFFDIYLETGNDFKVEMEGDENILPYIDIYVENNTLHIRSKRNVSLNPEHDVKIYIDAPVFKLVSSSGSGDIKSTAQVLASDEIKFQVNGSGDIEVNVDAPTVVAEINGSGDAELRGNCRYFDGSIKDSGDIKAGNLKAEDVKIFIAGSGDAEVFASIALDVTIRGSGGVKYSGDPKITQSVIGSGEIRRKN